MRLKVSYAVITLEKFDNRYELDICKDRGLFLLVLFLTDELPCRKVKRARELMDWALGSSEEDQGGNIAYLEKFEDQIILEIEYLEGRTLEMHKKNFVEIIEKWMK